MVRITLVMVRQEQIVGGVASRAPVTWKRLTPRINQLRSKFGRQIIGWKAAFVLAMTVSTRGTRLRPQYQTTLTKQKCFLHFLVSVPSSDVTIIILNLTCWLSSQSQQMGFCSNTSRLPPPPHLRPSGEVC